MMRTDPTDPLNPTMDVEIDGEVERRKIDYVRTIRDLEDRTVASLSRPVLHEDEVLIEPLGCMPKIIRRTP